MSLIKVRLRVISILFISLTLYTLFSLELMCLYDHGVTKGSYPEEKISAFLDLNVNSSKNHVVTHQWVCIHGNYFDYSKAVSTETFGYWKTRKRVYKMPKFVCDYPQKRITIHNVKPNGNQSRWGKDILGFYAEFTVRPINYEGYELRDTAYFLRFKEPFVPENFFHVTKQFIFPLHYLMKATGTLDTRLSKSAFFQKPVSRCPKVGGVPVPSKSTRYQQLFDMLGIHDFTRESLYPDKRYPGRTCYRNAVFSSGVHPEHARDAVEFIQEKLNVNKKGCPKKQLTIVVRKNYRRILNLRQLTKVATDLGYTVRAVALEKYTFAEQAQLIYCTEILVGVTGAGLQWAYFMRSHSGLIEIAWPECAWPFFFHGDEGKCLLALII